MPSVRFRLLTGLKRKIITSARLKGSWDDQGRPATDWGSPRPMTPFQAEDGCPAFFLEVPLQAPAGQLFQWGVIISTATQNDLWGVMPEIRDRNSAQRVLSFVLGPDGQQTVDYYLTDARRVGAQKLSAAGSSTAALRFTVWAPNARQVTALIAKTWNLDDPDRRPLGKTSINVQKIAGGYIDPSSIEERYPLHRQDDGYWATNGAEADLAVFCKFDHRPYMYEVIRDDGSLRYRTDLHSRCQIGAGTFDPKDAAYAGRILDLDGITGCSVVIDPDCVTTNFEERNGLGDVVYPETEWISTEDFWRDEYRPGRPVPRRVEDLVIYELHLGSLGFSHAGPGTLADAMQFVDYLEMLGVNAVELLPLSEFGDGGYNWGYGTSHYFAIEYAGGGRDKFKFFVRECHRRGIAVIVDVVYNHFTFEPERAEEHYDSADDSRNIYYWYEGKPSDYAHPNEGYCQNGSSGRTPRFHEEAVRQMFISSAAVLMEEFHIDGFRVDLTQAMHRDNQLEGADHRAVPDANIFGAKFLRQWCRTLKLLNPEVMLIAEDHTGWPAVLEAPDSGGLGFDATWYADFYHNLSGDTQHGGAAWLLRNAGYGDDRPLAMDTFAGVLGNSGHRVVVYHISHDEAGNSTGTRRTVSTAVNGAPLVGETRRYAEARSRVAAGLSLLSAGTPMFLFGEEVATERTFVYGQILAGKLDFAGLRAGEGQRMFRYYSDLIRLRLAHPGLRSRNIDVLAWHDEHRLIVFHRWNDLGDDLLMVASLNNQAFDRGYTFYQLRIPTGGWREIFNSDAAVYGGNNIGNSGAVLPSSGGTFTCVIPANGLLVFHRDS
jgi:1,4-alpha-glucan branching enzyme